MNIEVSERPLTEIRIPKSEVSQAIIDWVETWATFNHNETKNEFILVMPHPKHKALGGADIEEFLEDCPADLALVIRGAYENRVNERAGGSSNVTGFDLDNDFGFILIAFV
jgi:hypothetical protein